jgi:hypothetical protein
VVVIGIALMVYVVTFSKKYGQYGFLKATARKNVADVVRKKTIKKITQIEQSNNEQNKKHR